MKYLLTLDVGTTALKTCIFSRSFALLASVSEEYALETPKENIVEMEAEAYWQAARRGIHNAIKVSGINPAGICAVGVTTQGETVIPVDKNGNPLHKAIVWLDARAGEEASEILSRFGSAALYRTTGISDFSPACPAAKVLWMKRNLQETFSGTAKFLLLMDYLIFKLTGNFVTDGCLLSSTGYYDIGREVLWDEMLALLGLDASRFPEPVEVGGVAGRILEEVAHDLGINPHALIVTGGMDQASSAIGAGNIMEGVITETTGTALAVAATVENPDFGNAAGIYIMRHAVKGKYLLLPYNQTAGIVLKWFKDEFCRYESELCEREGKSVYACLDALAGAVPLLSGGLLLLPHFAGILTPDINPSARGVFFGIGLDTKKPHFIRAILEGVAFMLRENVGMLENMGVSVHEIRSLGGGSKSPLWSQIKADVNGKAVLTLEQEESTSLGAAMLAAVAAELCGSIEEACTAVRTRIVYTPDSGNAVSYDRAYARYRKLYECLKDLF